MGQTNACVKRGALPAAGAPKHSPNALQTMCAAIGRSGRAQAGRLRAQTNLGGVRRARARRARAAAAVEGRGPVPPSFLSILLCWESRRSLAARRLRFQTFVPGRRSRNGASKRPNSSTGRRSDKFSVGCWSRQTLGAGPPQPQLTRPPSGPGRSQDGVPGETSRASKPPVSPAGLESGARRPRRPAAAAGRRRAARAPGPTAG